MVTKSLFQDVEYSSHFLRDSSQSGMLLDALTNLYELTDWRCVLLSEEIDRTYHNMPVISMFKALALPYLLPIRGERTLARVIADKPAIQVLCDFSPDNLPKKRSFWHFRNKYKSIYSEMILKVLISLVLSGQKPNPHLPFVEDFVTEIEESHYSRSGNEIKIILDPYRPPVYVSRPGGIPDNSQIYKKEIDIILELAEERKKLFRGKDLDQFKENSKKYELKLGQVGRKQARGFVMILDLPVDVFTDLVSGESICFRVSHPYWFTDANKQAIRKGYYSQEFGVADKASKYDKACNILIIRDHNGKNQILLSRRKERGFGAGEFAVPGGKQRSLETLEECATRELFEETKITLIDSRPVSIYYTLKDLHDPTKQIMSVGVLAEEWEGDPVTLEPDTHEGWNWFDLDSLPEPIFEPTLIALDQYRSKKYPNLQWEDFEEKPLAQLSLFDPI